MDSIMPVKAEHLVVFDYGTGGVWAIIRARSEEEIVRAYPRLSIVRAAPQWMDAQYLAEMRANRLFDIDEPPSEWLSSTNREPPLQDR